MNPFRCRGPESNRHEAYTPADFESAASTNFTTPAYNDKLIKIYKKIKT